MHWGLGLRKVAGLGAVVRHELGDAAVTFARVPALGWITALHPRRGARGRACNV